MGINQRIINTSCIFASLRSGIRDPNCRYNPSVASNIIWELVKNESSFYVKFSYNGEYLDYCSKRQKDGAGEYYCTLEQFDQTVTNNVFPAYKSFCGFHDNHDWNKLEKLYYTVLGLLAVAILYGVIVTFLLYICRKKKKEEQELLKNAADELGELHKSEVSSHKFEMREGIDLFDDN